MKRLISSFMFLLLFTACRKEQPEMTELNKNCDCAHEVTADFYMEEMGTPINWPYDRESTDTDTIYANENVWFHPVEKNAEYTWYLGLETLAEEEIYRYFSEEHVGETYPMTLVVKKKPNTICFPNDDGYDSVVRYLTITNKLDIDAFFTDDNFRFEGLFRFKNTLRDGDSVDIALELKAQGEDGINYDRFEISNLNPIVPVYRAVSLGAWTYRQVWFNLSGYRRTRFYNKIGGEVELEMVPYTESEEFPHYYLKGRKL